MLIKFTLNDTPVETDIPPHLNCVDVLRNEFQCLSLFRGCDGKGCGTCLILMDDRPVPACLVRAFELRLRKIWTIEGIAEQESFKDIQTGYSQANTAPCAYCAPARAIATEALLRSAIIPSEKQLEEAVRATICPCTSTSGLIQAMQLAARIRERRRRLI